MTFAENLSQKIEAGKIIKPWLILGPFYEDLHARVQGLTLFERPGATVGETAMVEIVEEARKVAMAQPCEGEVETFRGQEKRWNLVRSPEEYLSWGTYNISNHLGAAFLSTILVPDEPGQRQWQLYVRNNARVQVYVNGQEVFDTAQNPVQPDDGVYHYSFQAVLNEGENVVNLAMFRLARMALVGSRLEVDTGVQACVTPVKSISPEARLAVEEEVSSIRLARDIFYPEHEVGFRLGCAPASSNPNSGVWLKSELLTESGKLMGEVKPTQAGMVSFGKGADLPDERYTIRNTWYDSTGTPLTETTFAIYKLSPVTPIPGYDRLEERKRAVLENFANNTEHSIHQIWTEVARYALGRYDEIDYSVIRSTCEFINARKDCSDFVIQGILRLMYWEREQQHLPTEINAMMKDTVLNFKYWVDEPGDTVMYMGSENHRLLFHVAEWMAGNLFPTEMFTNSGQNGLYHSAKAYMYITEWLRQRGRFGFDEFHSNSYYPICVSPLVNIYDFATHEGYYKLRQMTRAVLDQMFFYMAADSYEGIFGTVHARSYGIYLKYPDFEGTSDLVWLYFGTGSLVKTHSGMGGVTCATSSYKVPELLYHMANDKTTVVETKHRQGISPKDAKAIDFLVYRTPDYMISSWQDQRKGEFESSSHVGQVTLSKKNVIFWSCPHTVGEGSGFRPDYWSGSTTLPRTIQYRNVMSLSWRLTKFAWMSHCFFEQERFDEVRFVDRWAFARVNDGYVAIYVTDGFKIGDYGQYAGRELQCSAPEHTWLVECGRKADWGSFDAFVEAVSKAKVEVKDGVVTYESPSVGTFVTGWDVKPTVNGEPVQLKGYPLTESLWSYSRFGSGEMVLRYGDEEYELWFNQ